MNEDIQSRSAGYQECYVAYLDILGFSAKTRCSSEQSHLVDNLVEILGETALLESATISIWKTQIRAFSDSVVLFVPTESGRLNDVVQRVGYLYDRLLYSGFLLRGAFTVGLMYWDAEWSHSTNKVTRKHPQITLGPGLVEAYEFESTIAVYPRIIFSPKFMTHFGGRKGQPFCLGCNKVEDKKHIPFIDLTTYDDLVKYIRADHDGAPFLDMLNSSISRLLPNSTDPDDKKKISLRMIPHDEYMGNIRSHISENLNVSLRPKDRLKWLWLADYFNMSISHLDIIPLPVEWSPPNG